MKTILVIEDNTDIRENTQELLELEGYRILTADNGKTGLMSAKENLPDLILCDIMMPELNGYDVFNGLKIHAPTANIPFIFITASAEKSEVETGLGMGAQGYIRKPFEPQELFDTIYENSVNKINDKNPELLGTDISVNVLKKAKEKKPSDGFDFVENS